MARHKQFGQVWLIADSGSYWNYIEDAEGETLVDIDHWDYIQKVPHDVPLALYADAVSALTWAQEENRELDALERGDDASDITREELHEEWAFQYYQTR